MIDRRKVVGASAVGGILGIRSLLAQTEKQSNTATSASKVTIFLNGQTYSYPDGPKIPSYDVEFHRDGRVVFHLGALGALNDPAASIKPYHLNAYRVRIEGDGKVDDIDIPAHWWNANAVFYKRPSTSLAIKKNSRDIVAAKRTFLYGLPWEGCRIGAVANYTFKGPMDSAGITVYMPTTGERAEIGLITDPSALFMAGGSAAPMLAWAQAASSYPVHFRDDKTGKPIDLLKYPIANCYDIPGMGTPWLQTYPKNEQGGNIPGGWLVPQQAHYYEMSYVAFLATQNPQFLEDLQYSATFTVMCDATKSAQVGKATVSGEYRGLAWAFRNLFMAHVATMDAEAAGILPASCHPSSYWKALLDNQLAFYSKFMIAPENQVFRLLTPPGGFAPWQADHMLTVLALGVLTGHSDWAPLYLWCLKNVVDRTSGKSGYPVGWGAAYYMHSDMPDWYSSWLRMAPDWTPDSKPPSQAQIDALKADPFNGGVAMTGVESLMTTRAALVMAAYLEKIGLASVRAAYPDLDTCIGNVEKMLKRGGGMNARAAVIG